MGVYTYEQEALAAVKGLRSMVEELTKALRDVVYMAEQRGIHNSPALDQAHQVSRKGEQL